MSEKFFGLQSLLALKAEQPTQPLLEGPICTLGRFVVANAIGDNVEAAFQNRPKQVDDVKGFRKMEVLRGRDPREFLLFTFWDSEGDFREWFESHRFQDSHERIPGRLKLNPQETALKIFRHIAS